MRMFPTISSDVEGRPLLSAFSTVHVVVFFNCRNITLSDSHLMVNFHRILHFVASLLAILSQPVTRHSTYTALRAADLETETYSHQGVQNFKSAPTHLQKEINDISENQSHGNQSNHFETRCTSKLYKFILLQLLNSEENAAVKVQSISTMKFFTH